MFVLQPKDNWSMNDLDPIAWFQRGIRKTEAHATDRKFIVRPHPNHVASHGSTVKSEFPRGRRSCNTDRNTSHGDEKKYYRFHFQEAIANCTCCCNTQLNSRCRLSVHTWVYQRSDTSDLALSAGPCANKDLNDIETPEDA